MTTIANNWLVPSADPLNKPLYVATYYKSANQVITTSGATDISFDRQSSHNNTGGYITHATTSNTKDFVVVQPGLYLLEWNASILGTSSTSTDLLKQLSIDITRAPLVEQVTITQNASIPTARNYGQSVSATFYLQAGDVINCRVVNTFTGTISVLGFVNTFDLNTWFTWTFIR
jgi:hypothetical protein